MRSALYGTAIVAAPAFLATVAGSVHGRVAEPMARCQHGQEVAVCAGHAATDEPVLHREQIFAPPKPDTITPFTGNMTTLGWEPSIARAHLLESGFAMGTPLPLLAET